MADEKWWEAFPAADEPAADSGKWWEAFPRAEDPKEATLARRDLPDATAGSVARDIAAGALQIGPTAIKGVADIARLATGDRVGKDTSEYLERGMGAIRDTVGSERAAAQRENFQRDMADDKVGIGEALMRNKGALADQILPTVGSMFLPVGAAGAAGKAATATKAAKALDAAALAARVAQVQKAAGISATAAQNAASTFAELVDKGVPMEDAYLGAGITVPFSVVAGALTGGGAEVAAARALTGSGAAKMGARQLGKAAGQEGAQEMGEELGQIAGEAVATGETPSAVGAGKQLAVAGTLGAVMGGGVDVATQVGQRAQPGAAPGQPAPKSEENTAPALTGQAQDAINSGVEVAARARQRDGAPAAMDDATAATRLAELEVIDSTTGLNPEQQAEREALAQRAEAQAAREAELEAIGAPAESEENPHPALDHQALDASNSGAEAAAPAFNPAAVQAKTFPQFQLERGFKPSEMRRGTPEWDALLAEWAAVKTARAGTNPEGTGAVGAPTPEIQNRDRSRPASVVQMQGMAQNPDYMRLGVSRSPESGAPMVFAVGDQAHAAQALGRGDTAVMSDGQRVPFQYAVMEAADVQPSNFADGSVNPLFDAAHPGTVKALNNGRTAGLRAAYERGTAEGYKQELMADSTMHGIDPEVIAGMRAPVLVRLYSERDNQTNMGAKSQSQALGLSAAEQAATDAALVDAGVLEVFEAGGLDSAGNRHFARAFIGKLQAEGQDVAGMMDAGGALSPAGVTRLQAALVHKAYGDGDLVESMFGSTDNDIRAIGEALKEVAGEWANLRAAADAGAVNPQVDVTGNLLQAIRMVQKARRERASLYDAIQQVDMVTGDVPDPLTIGMLRLLYTGHYMTRPAGRDRLIESLRQYLGAALATRAEGDMFGEQVGPDAILAALSGQPAPSTNHDQPRTEPVRQPDPAQGSGQPAGGDPAGGRADGPGGQERGQGADRAGQAAADAGGRGQGQDAHDPVRQQDGQGDQGAGEDGRGEVAPELALASYTAEEIAARQDAQQQAELQRASEDAAAEQRAQADAERDSFTLTGSDRAADVAEARGQAPMFSRRDMAGQTETPEFKRWFGDSKVVDEDGRPLAMYHGTSASEDGQAFTMFDTFASNYGLMGQGGYFTADPEVASSYTSKGKGATPTVYKVYLSIKNPLDMDAEADAQAWQKQFPDAADFHEGGTTNESWYRAAEEALRDQELPMWEGAEIMQEGLRAMGFDGITHVGGGRLQTHGVRHRVFIAFEPEQIKSATGNNGDFDLANPDIRYSFAGQRATTADLGALDRAQAMAEQGASPASIQSATGWHKGVDGRWRFEISDDRAAFRHAASDDASIQAVEQQVRAAATVDDDGELFRATLGAGSDVTAAYGLTREEALERLADRVARQHFGVDFDINQVADGDVHALADVLEHADLFAAYPFLRGISVRFRKGGDSSENGAFDERAQAITLNADRQPEEMLSTLLHEVQHAIQAREDFGRGGTMDAQFTSAIGDVLRQMAEGEQRRVELWRARNPELLADAQQAAAAARDALKYESMERLLAYSERDKPSGVFRLIRSEMQWIYAQEFRNNPAAQELQRRFYGMPKRGDRRNAYIRGMAFDAQRLLRDSIAPEHLAAFKAEPRTMRSMVAAMKRQSAKADAKLQPLREQEGRARVAESLLQSSQRKTPYQLYRALSGEIEARATQARQHLTVEQRRARPVQADMDVSPAEAIVVVGGNEMLVPRARLDRQAPGFDDFDGQGLEQALIASDTAGAQAVARAQAQADAITAGWARKPDVQVVFDLSDPRVPAGVRSDAWAKKAQGASGEPAGFFYGGKVYLLASQLPTEAELRRVLFHEALGHYGLRALYGKALDGILQQIVEVRAKEVRSKAEQYGLDWISREDRLVAAEEVLAEMAEKSPQLGFVRRAVAAMRSFLRQNVPGFEGLRVSDAEIIRDYLLPARGWVERGAQQAAGAERAGRRPAFEPAFSLGEGGGRKALAEFAKADELFSLPKSDKDTVAGIAADNDGRITVGKPQSTAGRVEYTLTMQDGTKATLSVRDPNPWGGEQVYDTIYSDEGMELVPGRPGENPEDVPPTGDVWIDVSSLGTGDDGAKVYNIAATFAHNTGRIFIGDPHGLSAVALRRRLEHMISSALKFGTTAHLAPHPDQVRGGHGVPPLRWVYGDDVGNVERMIAASVKALDNAFPSSKKIAYDPDRGFYNAVTGSPVDRAELGVVWGRAAAVYRMAHGAGSTGQAGWRTVARAALFRHLATVAADSGGRPGAALAGGSAQRARLQSDGSTGPLGSDEERKSRIFYSRGPAGGGVNPGGPTPPPFRDKLSKLQDKVRELTGYSSVDDALYAWQDKFIDLKRIQARIKALNGVVSETNDAYRGEELYHKRVAKRTANFERDEVAPLVRAMKAADVGKEELEQFLHARHAPEANRVMAERNPSQAQIDAERARADKQVNDLRLQLQRAQAQGTAAVPVQKALAQALLEKERWDSAQAFQGTEEERLSLSGMSDAQAQAIMGALSPERRQQFDALAARVDRINAGTLKVLEDYGLMERATLQAWRDTYQHYVPLHRDEAHPDSKAHPIGQGFSTKGEAGKRRTGSNEKVTNILSHVLMQREAALTRGEKNNVVKRLYLLAAQNPDAELWTLDLPTKKAVDPDTGLVRTMVDQGAKLRDNVVTVRIGGHDKHIVFNPRNDRAVRLAQAMKNLDAMELDRFTRTMGKLTRWFAAVNTQYNPVFGAVNLIRDTQGMLLQLSTTPLAGKQAEVLRNVGANLRAIYADLRAQRKGAGPGQGAWARLFEQMQLDGGTTGYRDLYATPEDRAKALEKELKKLDQGNARAAAQGLVDWLSDFNEAMENTTRLAVYKAALDQGLSRQEAASIAKNITVNFNRKGRNTAVAGSWFAFLNAAIQGNKRMVETLAGPAGRRVMIGGVVLGMFSAAAGMAMMGGGDGADDEWKKIPEFVKERSLVIPLGRQDYVTIPMPLGFHVFPNIGRKMVEFATHDDPVKSRAGYLADMALIALNAYNPLGGADNLMQMVTPTPFDPVVAVATNKDWTGRAIEREKRSESDPTPGHARAKDAASQPARWAARGINAATGGNEWREGAWSPTPDAIDYLFGQLFGGVGRELVKAGKMTAAAVTGEELAAHQVIFAGRFYGNTRGTAGQSPAYYDNLKRINGDMAEAKGRVEQGEDADAVLRDVPLAMLDGPADRVDREISNLVKMRRKIQAGDDPDRREQVKAINGEIQQRMYHLNQVVAERLAERRALDR